jgi:hypothetical protein
MHARHFCYRMRWSKKNFSRRPLSLSERLPAGRQAARKYTWIELFVSARQIDVII